MPLLLGLDTGGTFTDAVLYDEAVGVVAKAKALTTHHDLALGVDEAVGRVVAASGRAAQEIGLVCLSTTLATNAMVEGHGGHVGLVFIGFDASDAARPDLKAALGDDPLVMIAGGHDAFGGERLPLDRAALSAAAAALAPGLSGFAVTGRFAVLNPAHEIEARDLLRAETGLPVTCGHELSARLDGPKRALTCVLNARLIHLVGALIGATEARLAARGIGAPLMVVRGDGALIGAETARARPIETIFSGPAASAVGGAFLAGARDALVSDIGGTTTDVVVLEHGRPRIDPMGALIGGFRTMVEAIAIRTCGLGGDSEVRLEQHGLDTALALGPRRAVPISLLATIQPELVHATLDRQLRAEVPGEQDGRFVLPLARPEAATGPDGDVLRRLADGPQAVDRCIATRRELRALDRLVARRLAIVAALTPSDAAHLLGLHGAWDGHAARKAADLFARRRGGNGRPFVASGDALAQTIVETLERRSAEFILDCAFAEDGFGDKPLARHPLTAAALDGHGGLVRLSVSLGVPVVGLGASAATYYPAIARRLGAESLVPEHAEVANAVGAVVGGVHAKVEIRVLQPIEGVFRIVGAGETRDLLDRAEALAAAQALARRAACHAAIEAGAASAEATVTVAEKVATIEGREIFVEALVTAEASGRPRMG